MTTETEQTTVLEPDQTPDEPDQVQVLNTEDTKLKRLEQLRAARLAKKAKKAEKVKEDADIRQALLRLKEENAELKTENKKRKREAPVKVTRQTEEESEDEEKCSLKQQMAISGIVGALGIASWYAQNRLFRPQTQTQKTTAPSTTKRTKTVKTTPTVFSPTQVPKQRVGSSGFTV